MKIKKDQVRTKRQSILSGRFLPILVLFAAVVFTVAVAGSTQEYRQRAQTIGNFCSGLAVAASADFKSQKSLACQFKSAAADKVMQSAGCPTKAAAEQAVNEACALPASQVPSGTCTGAVVGSTPDFKAQRATACGAKRNELIDGLTTRAGSGCTSRSQAEKAVNDACGGPPVPTSAVVPSSVVLGPATTAPTVPSGNNPPPPPPSPPSGGGGTDFFAMFIAFIQQIMQLLQSMKII